MDKEQSTEMVIAIAERRLTAIYGTPVKLVMKAGVCQGLTVSSIALAVSEATEISMDALKSKSRKREIVEARQIAMAIMCKERCASLAEIGFFFGGRDHSTVIHARTTVNDLIFTDKSFHTKYRLCLQYANSMRGNDNGNHSSHTKRYLTLGINN